MKNEKTKIKRYILIPDAKHIYQLVPNFQKQKHFKKETFRNKK